MIVWGSILLIIGLYFVLMGFAGAAGESGLAPLLVIGAMLSLGGVLLLVFGILNAVKTTKYNNELISRNEIFTTNCIYCGRPLSCTVKDFKYHRNYPAGYVDCPYCRGHVSRNAFSVGFQTGYQPYNNYQQNYYPPQN